MSIIDEKMKVSIITVCYNSEKTIEKTIRSVLNQTYPNIEYIVIDGKSTDGTLDVIKKYEALFCKKGYIYTYVSEKDAGMYDAMNKGIQKASGELIGLINSDDWYEVETVSKVVKTYKMNPYGDIFMGAIKLINGEQILTKYARDRRYKTSRDFNHPSMFVLKECYKTVGNYKLESVHDDYDWYLRAKQMKMKVIILEEVLTNYVTGGIGSEKNLKKSINRIGSKYKVYRNNGFSRLYFFECAIHELVKYMLLKGKRT